MAGKKKTEEACAAENHVLRIDGPDQKGLIYKITGVIFRKVYRFWRTGEYRSSSLIAFPSSE